MSSTPWINQKGFTIAEFGATMALLIVMMGSVLVMERSNSYVSYEPDTRLSSVAQTAMKSLPDKVRSQCLAQAPLRVEIREKIIRELNSTPGLPTLSSDTSNTLDRAELDCLFEHASKTTWEIDDPASTPLF